MVRLTPEDSKIASIGIRRMGSSWSVEESLLRYGYSRTGCNGGAIQKELDSVQNLTIRACLEMAKSCKTRKEIIDRLQVEFDDPFGMKRRHEAMRKASEK